MQVILSKRKHSTKDEYFYHHIQFPTIYLLQEQRLNHNNYSGQKINMNYFIQANGYYLDMHANIQCMDMHGFL
jgi:hypothetical protein